MSTLALCTIIKNEQQYLPYMLGCLDKICDEKIIVDTGSTDRSIEIAEAFGCYVIRAKWVNDFALVRNLAQSVAKSDWIIWLDGDEAIDEAGADTIKNELTESRQHDFWLIPRINFWKDLRHNAWYPDSQYKLYRNNIGLKWTGEIHEKIFNENDPDHKSRLGHSNINLYHYAYVKSSEDVRKKMATYIQIQNPGMDPNKVWACSTEHSFFSDIKQDFVQEYRKGVYPEIFSQLQVTSESIKWVNGSTIINFSNLPSLRIESSFQPTQNTAQTEKTFATNFTSDLLSIVIVTHNKVEYLEPCIKSIFNAVHIPFELIVVDNGSTEQNVQNFLMPLQKKHSNVKIVKNQENLGFAKGYNSGIEVSNGEFILVLNNDTLVMDWSIEKMLDHLKTNPDYGIIAPVSNNIHGEHQMIQAPKKDASFGDYISIVVKREHELKQSSWVTGCAMLFRRSLIDELAKIENPPRHGLFFCEDFPTGMGEDTDVGFAVCHRLNKKLGVTTDSLIWHWGQKTLESLDLDWHELQRKNDIILRKRWPEIFPDFKG